MPEVEQSIPLGEFLREFLRYLEDEGHAVPTGDVTADVIVADFIEKVRRGELRAGS